MDMKITINDKEYTIQKLPVKEAFNLRNSWVDGTGSINQEKMYELVLEHLVVKPRVKLEDFDEIWEVDELVGEAIDFQYGKKK